MKKLMRTSAILLLSFLFLGSIFAQGEKPNREDMEKKMKVLKVSFLTEKLDLTEEEAQSFWPVYNQYEDEMKAFRPERKEGDKPKVEEMSDAEIERKIQEMFELGYEKLKVQELYYDKFKSVLPLQKVMKLHKAEKDFKRELLEKFKEHKPGPPRD